MESSIIIRVKNEKQNLRKLLVILKNQTYQDFEIVIVDNDSSDGSEKIAFDYFSKDRVCVVRIENFSYPKACNLGAEKAKGKYLVFLSAHSFPISKTWLEDGLSNFKDEKVAGVFAFPMQTFFHASIAEVICYAIPGIIRAPIKNTKQGELGNTNSIIRRDLWLKHKFDESLTTGSEDYEWSLYWRRQKYLIVNDPKFRVFHSHHLGFKGIFIQQRRWNRMKKEINKKFNTTKY